jgi:hypothetical protein
MPRSTSSLPHSASGDASLAHVVKTGNKNAAAGEDAASDPLPLSSSFGPLPGVVPLAQVSAQAASDAATADSLYAPTSLGELAQLLSDHCQGVYVGVGAPGDAAGRVMLRLGGAMSGVTAEIITTAAGLCVRLHVADHDKWDEMTAHTGELERLLSASGPSSVRVESIFAGGRS